MRAIPVSAHVFLHDLVRAFQDISLWPKRRRENAFVWRPGSSKKSTFTVPNRVCFGAAEGKGGGLFKGEGKRREREDLFILPLQISRSNFWQVFVWLRFSPCFAPLGIISYKKICLFSLFFVCLQGAFIEIWSKRQKKPVFPEQCDYKN